MLDAATIKQIRNFELRLSHRIDTLYSGEYSSAFKGRGIEFSQVRKYIEGDDIRLIDWNVTARMREPYVKEYVEERELSVLFLVDISKSAYFGTRRRTKRQLISEFTGTMAYLAMVHQDKVGLVLFTNEVERSLPIKKGRPHFFQLMNHLMNHESKGDGTNITEALKILTKRSLRRSIVFIVSDFITEEDLYRPLKSIYRRHDIIIVRTRDEQELDLNFQGFIEVEDPETGEIYLLDSKDLSALRAYRKSMDEWTEYHTRVAKKLHIPIIELTTWTDISKPIIEFIRKRERGRSRR
ncbi:MAG: DUF58 domain-containing protein [bacterium]